MRELLEEDQDEAHEEMEFTSEEWEQLFRKIDDEIEKMQDEFDEHMKDVRKQQRRHITDHRAITQSKSAQHSLHQFRRKVLDSPNDDVALRRLGREYHKYLQESNVQGVDRRKMVQKFKDDIDQRFSRFGRDLMGIFRLLKRKEPYPEAKEGRAESLSQEDLVESEVRNSTIPKEWDKEDPMEDVNKSLHLIRENKKRRADTREE